MCKCGAKKCSGFIGDKTINNTSNKRGNTKDKKTLAPNSNEPQTKHGLHAFFEGGLVYQGAFWHVLAPSMNI